MIGLKVASSFYDLGSEEIRVENYTLTRLTPDEMDIQINFYKPKKISQSMTELDGLQIDFKDAKLFMAVDDGTQLA